MVKRGGETYAKNGLRMKEQEGELQSAHCFGHMKGLSVEALSVGYKKNTLLFQDISFSAVPDGISYS